MVIKKVLWWTTEKIYPSDPHDMRYKTYVAMLIETETLDRANSVYFGFANGIMQENAQNVATDTDTAQTNSWAK